MPRIFCLSLKRNQKPTFRAKDGKEIEAEDWMVEESYAVEKLVSNGDLRAPFDGVVVAKVFEYWKCYKKRSSPRCSKKLERLNEELKYMMGEGGLSMILQAGAYFDIEPLWYFLRRYPWDTISEGLPCQS